jgi:hypothetical protein
MNRLHPAVMFLGLACALGAQAADFAPAGARATLSVEYRFEASGKQQDRLELREWRVKRGVEVVAELVAIKPQPMPSLHAPEAAQLERAQQRSAQAQKAHAQMAPMMADVQALVARCGEDEKCIERETQKLGFGMAGSERMASQQKAGKALEAATRPDADRYQRWQGRTQKGGYTVEETWHVRHADPICMSLPGQRCNHDLKRQGAAQWPAGPSQAQVEFDLEANTMTLLLPGANGPLEVTETQTTDEPEGTHSWSTPKGPQKSVVGIGTTAEGKAFSGITLPLKGGWRTQSGEQVLPASAGAWHGASGEGGKLVIRWRFTAR